MCLLLQIIWTWPEDIAVLLWRMMPSVHKYDIISDTFKYQLNTPPVSFIIRLWAQHESCGALSGVEATQINPCEPCRNTRVSRNCGI